MGYIREQKGFDFVINREPLTDKARKEISDFIRKYKARNINPELQSIKYSKSKRTKSLQA